MFKKLLKIVGTAFLLLLVLAACLATWSYLSASKHTKAAEPYLTKNLPEAVSWDFENLKPLLTPKALEAFETERGQKIYELFSRLGKLKSLEESKFLRSQSGVTTSTGIYDVVIFSTLGHFESGDANITTTLSVVDGSYSIQAININSDIFLE
ncbi:hypothetical protein [Granulosicoccus antarcticus]|uniref:DUF4019 domain-containing protein n=1 Tax=Granulosicoccus antarcticus IMCC3135 TaxID=1192854 RepID=A0A2Z2NRX5_9GAMM|nr:hypothetical protein [Granulosicoccus antarcticus]ASJ70297.1 hypothetical protein IMCC3135_00855 [Granulosicoccus antarcticus IMCC3135]